MISQSTDFDSMKPSVMDQGIPSGYRRQPPSVDPLAGIPPPAYSRGILDDSIISLYPDGPSYHPSTGNCGQSGRMIDPMGHPCWEGGPNGNMRHSTQESMGSRSRSVGLSKYHIPCFRPSRRSNPLQHKAWMEMMSGGFTQSCSNWSIVKLLLPEGFVKALQTTYLPALQLLEQRSEAIFAVSKENTSMEIESGQGRDVQTRLVMISAIQLNRLVYAVTWTIDLLFADVIASENSNQNLKRFFNVKCVLPRSSISRFIGRGGETIRRVQEESTLSMSVSTLDRTISERVLNMGFFIKDGPGQNPQNAMKLDSLLSVFQVIIQVLQTDRNYSMNYLPIPENLGRPRVDSYTGSGAVKPTRDDLLKLMRQEDATKGDAHFFDDLGRRSGSLDSQQMEDAAAEAIKDVETEDHRLIPAPQFIIDDHPTSDPRRRLDNGNSFDRGPQAFENHGLPPSVLHHYPGSGLGPGMPPPGGWNQQSIDWSLKTSMSQPTFHPSFPLGAHLQRSSSPPQGTGPSGKSKTGSAGQANTGVIGTPPSPYNLHGSLTYSQGPLTDSMIQATTNTTPPKPLASQTFPMGHSYAPYPSSTTRDVLSSYVKIEIDLRRGKITGSLDTSALRDVGSISGKHVIYCPLSDLTDEICARIEQSALLASITTNDDPVLASNGTSPPQPSSATLPSSGTNSGCSEPNSCPMPEMTDIPVSMEDYYPLATSLTSPMNGGSVPGSLANSMVGPLGHCNPAMMLQSVHSMHPMGTGPPMSHVSGPVGPTLSMNSSMNGGSQNPSNPQWEDTVVAEDEESF